MLENQENNSKKTITVVATDYIIKSLFLLEYPFDLSRLTLFYCQTPSALSNSMFKFQVTTEILFQEKATVQT
jgi:hypothetical protein